MTISYKNLQHLVEGLSSGFESLDLIGVYDFENKNLKWFLNKNHWDTMALNALLTKQEFVSLGFKQFKIDYVEGGIFLLYELKKGYWLILGTPEKLYAQLNLFLRQMQVDTIALESGEASQPAVTHFAKVEDPFFQKLNAAKRLQQAILPRRESFENVFDKSVIYYQPQDVIGGDIYWIREFGDEVFVVVADCTGHSVEGALASMTVHSLLSDIIRNGLSPKDIGEAFFERLDSYKIEGDAYSIGVELGIMKLDNKKKIVSYLTTGIPIMLQQKGKLEVKKLRNRFGHDNKPMEIALFEENIKVDKSDKIVMFSDGLIDLFDGQNAKKLGLKGVKELTEKLVSNGSFNDNHFVKLIKDWQGTTEQIDDITYVALEF